MNKIAIKCKNAEHGKEIIKYLESIGANTEHILEGKSTNSYYYIVNNEIYFDPELPNGYTEIELPEEQKIPELPLGVLMEVSDNEDFPENNTQKKYVFGKYNEIYKYLSWANELKDYILFWKYARPIQKEKEVHLTLEDISNGKGVGVPPHLIRVKQ